jgi:hypothetical protein
VKKGIQSITPTLSLTLEGGRCEKNFLLVVTPVRTRRVESPTGVQEVFKVLKTLDSGFRRNDRKKAQSNFFTPSG